MAVLKSPSSRSRRRSRSGVWRRGAAVLAVVVPIRPPAPDLGLGKEGLERLGIREPEAPQLEISLRQGRAMLVRGGHRQRVGSPYAAPRAGS
jgi:hypothetical protein